MNFRSFLQNEKIYIAAFSSLIRFFQTVSAQDFKAQFDKLFEKEDFAGMEKLLPTWEKAKSDDPELYVSYFNFYFSKSRTENLILTKEKESKDSVGLTKENEEKPTAYLGSQIAFKKEDFDKGIFYINKGIEKFPNRLDMRFGKIYTLGQIEDYQMFTSEIVKIIDYSNVNKNQWFWMQNEKIENPEKFMLNAIQDYIVQLFNAGGENIENVKTISETVLKYYPNSVENLSNFAIYYLIKEDFDKALPPLLKAEKLAPTDAVVLNNIAWIYFNKADNVNALKYYELVSKYGNKQQKSEANEKIVELKSKIKAAS